MADEAPVAIVIHGGAGTFTREGMTHEMLAAYRSTLREAVTSGHRVLKEGGSSLDAVTVAIRIMEDSPLFNAGKAPCLTTKASTNSMRPSWTAQTWPPAQSPDCNIYATP